MIGHPLHPITIDSSDLAEAMTDAGRVLDEVFDALGPPPGWRDCSAAEGRQPTSANGCGQDPVAPAGAAVALPGCRVVGGGR